MGRQRNTTKCPVCKHGDINKDGYNGKMLNGKIACPDCIVGELLGKHS